MNPTVSLELLDPATPEPTTTRLFSQMEGELPVFARVNSGWVSDPCCKDSPDQWHAQFEHCEA